jgi:hypothetical protein
MLESALTAVGAVVLFVLAYGIGHASGKSSGKVEAYEQANDIDTGEGDDA